MKPIRLVLIPALTSQPAPFMIVAGDGGVLARGVLTPEAAERPEPMRTVAVCPGSGVSVRWLDLPAGGAVQVAAAAAWSLRDDLAASPDRLVTVVGPPPAPGEPRLTATVGRNLLEAWTDYLETLGVRADALIPDMLTVTAPEEDEVLRAVTFGDGVALRGRRFAATVQPDLVELVAGERRVEPVEDARTIEHTLAASALSPAVNLLGSGRERAAGQVGWRRAAGLAAAVMLSPLLLTMAGAVRDDHVARRLERRAVAAIAAVDPGLARQPDPVAALRQRAASAPPPGGTTAAAAALFSAVESVEGTEIDMLSAAPGDGLKATVSHAAFSDMEAVGRAMSEAGLAVTENSTLEDGGRVVSDISIGARP